MRADEFCDHQKLQADRAATGYENVFAGDDTGLLHGFVNRVDRLDEGCFLKSDIVGQGDDAAFRNPGHRFDIFGKAATVGREASGEASGFVLLALGKRTAFAVKTCAARNVMKAHHAIARPEFRHGRADGDDGAGQFMTKDLRRFNVTLENFLDVCAANAAGSDFDEEFAFANFRHVDFFDPNDSLFAVDTRAHGFGDGVECTWRGGSSFCCAHQTATFAGPVAQGIPTNATIKSFKKEASFVA